MCQSKTWQLDKKRKAATLRFISECSTLIRLPEIVDNETVHDAHENKRNNKEHDVQENGENLLKGLIRPDFATLSATYEDQLNIFNELYKCPNEFCLSKHITRRSI